MDTVDFLKDTYGFVEANSFEQMCLWEKFSMASLVRTTENIYVWQENLSGKLVCIGKIENTDKEVWLALTTSIINDKKIVFYYPSGAYVDWNMIDNWLDKNAPPSAVSSLTGRGYRHADAMNFTNIFIG